MKIKNKLPLLVFLAIVLALFAGYRLWKDCTTDVLAPVISFDDSVLEVSIHDDPSKMFQGMTVTMTGMAM